MSHHNNCSGPFMSHHQGSLDRPTRHTRQLSHGNAIFQPLHGTLELLLLDVIQSPSFRIGQNEYRLDVRPTSVFVTGVTAVSCLGKLMGLGVTIIASPSIAPENRILIENAGARLILMGETHAQRVAEARSLSVSTRAYFLNQYENPANPGTHRDWTAPELFAQFPQCDAVFVCASSGGTAAGFSTYMKKHAPTINLITVDPTSSDVVAPPFAPPNDEVTSPTILGFGSAERSHFANNIPSDCMIRLTDVDAVAVQQMLSEGYGVNIGFSSGGIVAGATQWLVEQKGGREIVCVCPDSSERYSGPSYTREALLCRYALLADRLAAKAEFFQQSIVSVQRIQFRALDGQSYSRSGGQVRN
jgi:cysteine synthase